MPASLRYTVLVQAYVVSSEREAKEASEARERVCLRCTLWEAGTFRTPPSESQELPSFFGTIALPQWAPHNTTASDVGRRERDNSIVVHMF